MWDFGTVRHTSRPSTIGRSNPIQVSGPPLTWENNGTARSGSSDVTTGHRGFGSGSSGSSKYASSITTKGELPPLPPSAPPTPKRFEQSTVRHMPPPSAPDASRGSQRTIQREPSDEYEDYDDQYVDTYPAKDPLSHRLEDVQLDDDLPDTTMLDSVILPAIASVRTFLWLYLPSLIAFI